jgi:hypothetical protein
LEEIDLAGYPQGSIIGIPELFLGEPKQILKQRVVEVIGFHLKLTDNVVFTNNIHAYATFGDSV